MKPEDEKTQEEKLGEEVLALKTRIKNAEYDLNHMFKGNPMVEKKLEESQKTLTMKEQILQELSGGPIEPVDKTQQIREVEEKLATEDNPAISKDQEKLIEEEFEDEFM